MEKRLTEKERKEYPIMAAAEDRLYASYEKDREALIGYCKCLEGSDISLVYRLVRRIVLSETA